jgi:hypothetical protein
MREFGEERDWGLADLAAFEPRGLGEDLFAREYGETAVLATKTE